MANMAMFETLSNQCSKRTTRLYSTSFASAIKLLHRDLRQPIHNIYGFVRLADEIVDTFHGFPKRELLEEFKTATMQAIERRISLNPILNSFQQTVNRYAITGELIFAFFDSMEMDLEKRVYDNGNYENYIYGSAEVVGLMCLRVFCEGDHRRYSDLYRYARSLGAAFQKVNFLRDIKADALELGRMYFPGCDFMNFSAEDKATIEADIQADLDHAYEGIMQLPAKAKLGVYVAYRYYLALFRKIKRMKPVVILENRVRVPNHNKLLIVAQAGMRKRLKLL